MIDAIVVDASVALKWLVPEPDSDRAAELLNRPLLSLDFMQIECGSALWSRVRRGMFSRDDAIRMMGILRGAPLTWVPVGGVAEDAFSVALELDHPIYDCLYLALARAEGLSVVTADVRFARALRRVEAADLPEVLLLSEIAGRA
jgi:predicted nucleic acid-binding protein